MKFNQIKYHIKKLIPSFLLDNYSKFNYSKKNSRFHSKYINEVFQEIYDENYWKNSESISGPGSSLEQMSPVISALNAMIKDLKINRLLDIPCGDFNWMKEVNLSTIDYTGADIVEAIIKKNNAIYRKANIVFKQMDLTQDSLGTHDLILNKDCLVHFSYEDIFKSLDNIRKSNCTYLMTTTFPGHQVNYDITTGDWRPLNFEKKPFRFPEPLIKIKEYCPEGFEKESKGKMLALWRVEDLFD